jgi:hypothetical protein
MGDGGPEASSLYYAQSCNPLHDIVLLEINMPTKLKPIDSQIRVYDAPEALRSGGESRPFEYPHLYQIQAGDWRISYAVEHNRLAILVLEVLTPEGVVRKDPASEKLTRKMKIKLLDWPEGSPSRDLPPEDLGKKLKIKLLDLADEVAADEHEAHRQRTRIKLSSPPPRKPGTGRITRLDPSRSAQNADATDQAAAASDPNPDRKVPPLDAPSM